MATKVLTVLDSLRTEIGELDDPRAVGELRHGIGALVKVARARGAALGEINELVGYRIRAGMRGGALLRETVRRGPPLKSQRATSIRGGCANPLPEGIDKHTSSRWKKLANTVEEDELLTYLSQCNRDDDEASEAGLFRHIRAKTKAEKKSAAEDVVEDVADDLDHFVNSEMRFGCVYVDPPWQYGNQATRGSTDDHYPTMPLDEICALPIEKIAGDDSHLHLWTTNAFLFDAKSVIDAWGYEYKSCFVWVKPQMGMGNYWRVSHEYLLLGVRGSCSFDVHDEMSWAEYPRGRHSRKPPEIRKVLEKVSPSPRIELFAREAHHGWASWGNDIEDGGIFGTR